jgi:hypothetical protein
MQNADGEEEEMRKVWCCKWAGWCPFKFDETLRAH